MFAFENDGEAVWFELIPDSDVPTDKLTGQAYCSAGDYGGTFGDGSAADATATWPLVNKPDRCLPGHRRRRRRISVNGRRGCRDRVG